MDAPARARNPQAVLFACGQNSVRSPMAEALAKRHVPGSFVASAGVRAGSRDPFVDAHVQTDGARGLGFGERVGQRGAA